MRVKIAASCLPPCGVLVQGEVETSSREFLHRFAFPAPAARSIDAPRTEVEEMRLATFAPDSKDWFVDCPLCGRPIAIDPGAKTRS
jgi:hypothetical protein